MVVNVGLTPEPQADYKIELEQLLHGDEGRYAYLFPFRDRIPTITRNPFADITIAAKPDEFVVKQALNIDYIGWTTRAILGLNLFPSQIAQLWFLWKTPFPMLIASRGAGKSFILAVYAVLRALLDPGSKIVIVGAGLRQAKLVFSYIESIWNSASVLRSIVGGGKKSGPRQNVDICHFRLGESTILALPLGDGSKIRGFRASVIIADEFASIPEDIFDIVVRGFASTHKSPVDHAKRMAVARRVRRLGAPPHVARAIADNRMKGNQIVIAGTAYYAFNHFYRKFMMYKQIINSGGKEGKVNDIFGGPNAVPEGFNHLDYAIMRIPYTAVQEGLLDQRQLAHAKAVLPKNIFLMEYGASFIRDSDGFFARSLIEACTTHENAPIVTMDGPVWFTPRMFGDANCRYVMGVDPAAQRDNLAITILEWHRYHYRVVHVWAINKDVFQKRKRDGTVKAADYYEYCTWKIRSLAGAFHVERIEMDQAGGGLAIAEMLRNRKLLDPGQGEVPIYEIISPEKGKEKETDGLTDGPHILHLVAQSSEFNATSNMFMHKSFETKRLLMPGFDAVKVLAAIRAEAEHGVTVDTFEDLVSEIERLKDELCTIVVSETTTGRERFDTPSVAQATALEGQKKKGRLRKDRYTSLLLAHRYVYENDTAPPPSLDYEDVNGGIHAGIVDPTEAFYRGPGIGSMRNADWGGAGGGGAGIKHGDRV